METFNLEFDKAQLFIDEKNPNKNTEIFFRKKKEDLEAQLANRESNYDLLERYDKFIKDTELNLNRIRGNVTKKQQMLSQIIFNMREIVMEEVNHSTENQIQHSRQIRQ